MDLYYLYNGMNNIVNLSMNNQDYLVNSKKIHNDPLVLLDLESSFNLNGGAVAPALVGGAATDAAKDVAKDAAKSGPAKDVPAKSGEGEGAGEEKEGSLSKSNLKNILTNTFSSSNKDGKKTTIADLFSTTTNLFKEESNDRKKDRKKDKALKKAQLEDLKTKKEKAISDAKAATNVKNKELAKIAEEEADAKKLALEAEIKAAEQAEKEAEEEAKKEEEEMAAELDAKDIAEEEEAQQKRDQKESLSSKGTNALKLLIKIVVFLAFITLIPIAPFIAISYYSFKKLKDYYDNQIVTL
jgi:hypothetical protein